MVSIFQIADFAFDIEFVFQNHSQALIFALKFFLESFALAELYHLVRLLDHEDLDTLVAGDQVTEVLDVLDPEEVGGAKVVPTAEFVDLKLHSF